MVDEGVLTDIRKAAKTIIDANVPVGAKYTSDGTTEATFTRLTGGIQGPFKSRHEKLVSVWAKGSQETCCMDFVGWYAGTLASKLGYDLKGENLGRFDIDKVISKKSAWVKADGSADPKYGDVLLHTGVHIDVAIGFEDRRLWRVAAGQGIVGQRDILMRVKGGGPYNFRNLKGWVDIDLYFGAGASSSTVPTRTVTPPEWLYGWWKVNWRGDAYGYYFYRDGKVAWTENFKQSTSQPPVSTEAKGTFVVDHSGKIIIQWPSGSVETFSRGKTTRELGGTWKGKDGSQASLSASKLDGNRRIA